MVIIQETCQTITMAILVNNAIKILNRNVVKAKVTIIQHLHESESISTKNNKYKTRGIITGASKFCMGLIIC